METTNVLVLYASRHGATRQIAEQVWRSLRESGMHVELRAAEQAPDPAHYQAIVLGTAIYMGQWRSEASRWLQRHQFALSRMPLWIFSSGPTGQGDPAELLKGETVPHKLQSLMEVIKPREIRVFHGALRRDELNLLERIAVKTVKAPFGDFRDWKAIEQWAAEISQSLHGAEFLPSKTLPELQVETTPAETAVGVV
ncbi:MAG: flavodoxin domain-containing protein [Saprospiraceae bacterium]|nr:flavodoxin domain-containing protein [Saprospiraceae bacterium]